MSSTSPAVQAVLDLFQGPLADVRFADVDAKGLANLADEVERAATAVRDQEAQLEGLRLSLEQRKEALLSLAQRALAYAKVFAENDEALMANLNAISLPRAPKARKVERSKAETTEETSNEARSEAVDKSSTDARARDADEVTEAASAPPAPSRKGKRRGAASASTASA